jgi:hypothetical protein
MVLRLVNLALAASALFNGAKLLFGADASQSLAAWMVSIAAPDGAHPDALLLGRLAVNLYLPATIALWVMVALRWDRRLPEPIDWPMRAGLLLSWSIYLVLGIASTFIDLDAQSGAAVVGAFAGLFALVALLILCVAGVLVEAKAFADADRGGSSHRTALLAWSLVPLLVLVAPLALT